MNFKSAGLLALCGCMSFVSCRPQTKSPDSQEYSCDVLLLGAVVNKGKYKIRVNSTISIKSVLDYAGGVDREMLDVFVNKNTVYITKKESGIIYRVGEPDWGKPLDFKLSDGDIFNVSH